MPEGSKSAVQDLPWLSPALLSISAPHQNLWVIDRVLAGGNAFFQASAGQKEGSLRTW